MRKVLVCEFTPTEVSYLKALLYSEIEFRTDELIGLYNCDADLDTIVMLEDDMLTYSDILQEIINKQQTFENV